MQGIMNATGVAATVPTNELNLSKEFPRLMQHMIATAMIKVLYRLMTQYFSFDSFIFL
jgi:hypothetical protein